MKVKDRVHVKVRLMGIVKVNGIRKDTNKDRYKDVDEAEDENEEDGDKDEDTNNAAAKAIAISFRARCPERPLKPTRTKQSSGLGSMLYRGKPRR